MSQDDLTSYEPIENVQLGPRPFYLANDVDDEELREQLLACADGPFSVSQFSIGHRGAPMQFPEHTVESYVAAAQMGAGILECDVTFTQDRELVCRHAQCDLHTTTNILAIPELAAKCSQPFTPAVIDPETGEVLEPASARCCTSDITLEEFRMLEGKMDAFNPAGTTVEAYMDGTANWRTDLYAQSGTLMTHAESIELFAALGVGMTPELKSPQVEMPFEGDYTQEDYAQQLIDEYVAAGIDPSSVWAQSFNLDDVLYWVENAPEFGEQAVFLESRYDDGSFAADSQVEPSLQEIADMGVNIIAPPLWYLLTLDENNEIVPSEYATASTAAGMDIITWTIERSGTLADGGGWYYQTTTPVIDNSGDMMETLHVLAQDVGIIGIFSDWPATTTYYANCFGF
ncbi:MAG: glycerophosphodiester phosphodiesterase [Chloroflexi bacterium]|nr:glycerophosphodiester phosphodiesterase [Chloroflexota bacterium]